MTDTLEQLEGRSEEDVSSLVDAVWERVPEGIPDSDDDG